MSKLDEPIWLVKSGGRILGPYSLINIRELLRTKEVVPLDEISLPLGRWGHIRDNSEFKEVIDELRIRELRRNDENTDTVGAQTMDQTSSLTETIPLEQQQATITQEMESIEYDLTQKIFDDEPRDVTASIPPGRGEHEVRRFGSTDVVKQETKSFSGWVFRITFGVIMVLSAFVSYKKLIHEPKAKSLKYEDFVSSAYKKYHLGQYEGALEDFKKAYDLNEKDPSIYVHFGTLLVSLERQTVQGKRLLDQVLDLNDENKKYALIGIGLAHLFDKEWRFAQKNFEEALQLDKDNSSALINRGSIDYLNGDFNSAEGYFSQAISNKSEDNSGFVYFILNAIQKNKKNQDVKIWQGYLTQVQHFIASKYDYKQEVNLLESYIYFLLNKKDLMLDSIKRTLDTDPRLTDSHKHDLLVYSDAISWKKLLPMCDEIYKKNGKDVLVVTLLSYCNLKAGNIEKAEKLSSRIQESNPNNALLLAVSSFIQSKSGKDASATVILGRAADNNKLSNYQLPSILQAAFCQHAKDFECATDQWKRVLAKDESSLQAMVNLALIEAQQGDFSDVKNKILQGYSLSKHYMPLLELNELSEQIPAN